MNTANNFYIFTGAPGTGKTTILNQLTAHFNIVSEPARKVIANQRAINGNGLWDKNRQCFIDLLLKLSVSNYIDADQTTITLFDRSIVDVIAYASYGDIDTSKSKNASAKHLYNKNVFLLPPWEEIYENDDERTMTYEESLDFHKHIVNAYSDYNLIEVPKASVKERVRFINEILNNRMGA